MAASQRGPDPSDSWRRMSAMVMRASTAIAERVGELRILDLLNRFVADVSLAVAEAGGEIWPRQLFRYDASMPSRSI